MQLRAESDELDQQHRQKRVRDAAAESDELDQQHRQKQVRVITVLVDSAHTNKLKTNCHVLVFVCCTGEFERDVAGGTGEASQRADVTAG